MSGKLLKLALLCLLFSRALYAQEIIDLHQNEWKCAKASEVKDKGADISRPSFQLQSWMPAVVPGTVLTTLVHNNKFPDPYFGLNNESIPDIYKTGPEYYTYWFVCDFNIANAQQDEQTFLNLDGVNYSFELYLNGNKLNTKDQGMFLRHRYNISQFLSKDQHNRLAIIVYPPSPAGNPNGGQGGDGTIAHSVTNQYPAGWDWIQPIRDRNTGIWDKVFIERTESVAIRNPHIVTIVPGMRTTGTKQEPAIIKVSAELENPTNSGVEGFLQYKLGGEEVSQIAFIPAHSTQLVALEDHKLKNPRLWWPNGYGPQNLYDLNLKFTIIKHSTPSDEKKISFGVRQIETVWNKETMSREIHVNGQKIFMKGGNWITSDAMLQFSKERYDHQIRFHKEMNLNLIRVWGGGITERPEFYDACDKYGLLVFQEFWITGDCNGRWYDKMKKEDTLARRKYPDDHSLFIESAADQVKLLRNHPSLAFWCGGNEILPPADLLRAIRDSIVPNLDGTRYFFNYSNDDSMSYHSGDGPYVIQDPRYFWRHRSFPFNSEIGSIGIGEIESLERFIPKEHLVIPETTLSNKKTITDTVWKYHKFITYGHATDAYGKPKDLEDFAKKAQLVNYDQYRAMMEGFSAHMWDWYTGVIIWKTSNPWKALLGEMYDHSLDPNACLYGTQKGAEPVHIMFDPLDSSAIIVNNTFDILAGLTILVKAWDINGKGSTIGVLPASIGPSRTAKSPAIGKELRDTEKQSLHKADFVSLQLLDVAQHVISENLYALADAKGNYPRLQQMPSAKLSVTNKKMAEGKAEIILSNPVNGPIAYFNRLSIVDSKNKRRILPVHYSDNYVSVLPGEEKTITIDYPIQNGTTAMFCIEGWNFKKQYFDLP